MSNEKQYNLSHSEGFIHAFAMFNYLREKGAIIEIKEILPTRTNTQNKALHLFFKLLAQALNDHGEYYRYFDYRGEVVDIQWTSDLVKDYIFRPLMKVITDKTSTAHLTTKEIDPIYDVIHRHYSAKGIELFFPSRFTQFLDQMK